MTSRGIQRLDRKAKALGIEVLVSGASRTFCLYGREIRYRSRGMGTYQVKAFANGVLDAEDTVSEERIESLLLQAASTSRS